LVRIAHIICNHPLPTNAFFNLYRSSTLYC